MKAFAVINPILEAIKYFYLKANNTCIRQKIDNIIRNREVTTEQAEAIMHPAMVLERFLDENIVMPSCAEELFGDIPCIEGADSLNTCIAALLTDRALRSEIRNIDEAEQLLLSQTQPQAISNITMNLTSANIHAAAEAHSYNGLLSVLEGLPLTNDSRWKILFVLQHYEQYVRLICNSLRSAVGLIEANPQLYAYALKDFEHDYSNISDIIEIIEDENGVDTDSKDGRVYPTVIGSNSFTVHTGESDGTRTVYYVGLGVRAIGRLPLRGIEKMDYDEAFRILADKNRMKIMQLLCGEQAYGLELAEKLKLSPNTISHHMSKLQKCGLVISSFEGNRVYYRANKAAVDEFIRMLSKKLRVK